MIGVKFGGDRVAIACRMLRRSVLPVAVLTISACGWLTDTVVVVKNVGSHRIDAVRVDAGGRVDEIGSINADAQVSVTPAIKQDSSVSVLYLEAGREVACHGDVLPDPESAGTHRSGDRQRCLQGHRRHPLANKPGSDPFRDGKESAPDPEVLSHDTSIPNAIAADELARTVTLPALTVTASPPAAGLVGSAAPAIGHQS